MRETKFRGKSVMSIKEMDEMTIPHKNGWVYGNLIKNGNDPFIVGSVADVSEEYLCPEWWWRVKSETVGQSTGLHDKHGTEIYEKDNIEDNVGIGFVEYVKSCAAFRVNYGDGTCKWFIDYLDSEFKTIEVIEKEPVK